MNWSWFGPKNGYGSGIASWQGLLVIILGIGGIIAARSLLTGPIKDWISGGLLVALLVIYFCTYDKDAIT